jgi:hypothetical protein
LIEYTYNVSHISPLPHTALPRHRVRIGPFSLICCSVLSNLYLEKTKKSIAKRGSCTWRIRINRTDVAGADKVACRRELLPDPTTPPRSYSCFTRRGGRGGFSGSAQPRVPHRSPWLTAPAAGATAGRETGAPPARTRPDRSGRPLPPACGTASVAPSPFRWSAGSCTYSLRIIGTGLSGAVHDA